MERILEKAHKKIKALYKGRKLFFYLYIILLKDCGDDAVRKFKFLKFGG